MKQITRYLIITACFIMSCGQSNENRNNKAGDDWPVYGGNNSGNRYSPLAQINRSNVRQLKVAWTYNTGENADTTKRGYEIQCQPIIVNGIMYGTVNANEIPWDLRMTDIATKKREIASTGKALFLTNCAVCHGADLKGGGAEIPELLTIGKRLKENEIAGVLKTGRGKMPSFQSISESKRQAIIRFLLNPGGKEKAADPHTMSKIAIKENGADFPYVPPYINNGQIQFIAPDGYPGIKPPWGTLSAINLNTGEFVWKVPLGEFPALKKMGVPPTGTENHGGPVVTAGGLLFIGATRDEMFRAFDTRTGKILWEYQLPAGAFATPSSYSIGGKQYIVVAAGGTKYGLKPGGTYIAFALP